MPRYQVFNRKSKADPLKLHWCETIYEASAVYDVADKAGDKALIYDRASYDTIKMNF